MGDSEELCLLNYQIGAYNLEGNAFTFNVAESYGPDPLALYVGCLGKESLVPQLESQILVVTGILTLSRTKTEFNLDYECPELLPYMCLGSKEFKLSLP